jgi:hypothetical protein
MTDVSSTSPIRPNVGGDLAASEVVGRDELVADLLARLVHESIRIEDPRRMGKSTTLKLLATFSSDDAPIVYCTVQGYETADEIVLDIAQSLHTQLGRVERFAEALRGFFDKATLDTGIVAFEASLTNTDATAKLEQLLARLSGRFADGRLIIAVDELPWAISNIARGADPKTQGAAAAGAFLQALQRIRDKYPDIRWVIAGSIGFHHVLRLAGQTNAVLTGLRPESCGPLQDAHTKTLVRRLLAGAGIARPHEAVIQQIAADSGGIPFIAHHLVELLARRDEPTADAATEVFEEFVLDRGRSAELTHLLQRLDTYMSKDEAAAAEKILDACAIDGTHAFDVLQRAADVDREHALTILNWLVDDHYLVETGAGFTWRFDVLRKVWVARRRLA